MGPERTAKGIEHRKAIAHELREAGVGNAQIRLQLNDILEYGTVLGESGKLHVLGEYADSVRERLRTKLEAVPTSEIRRLDAEKTYVGLLLRTIGEKTGITLRTSGETKAELEQDLWKKLREIGISLNMRHALEILVPAWMIRRRGDGKLICELPDVHPLELASKAVPYLWNADRVDPKEKEQVLEVIAASADPRRAFLALFYRRDGVSFVPSPQAASPANIPPTSTAPKKEPSPKTAQQSLPTCPPDREIHALFEESRSLFRAPEPSAEAVAALANARNIFRDENHPAWEGHRSLLAVSQADEVPTSSPDPQEALADVALWARTEREEERTFVLCLHSALSEAVGRFFRVCEEISPWSQSCKGEAEDLTEQPVRKDVSSFLQYQALLQDSLRKSSSKLGGEQAARKSGLAAILQESMQESLFASAFLQFLGRRFPLLFGGGTQGKDMLLQTIENILQEISNAPDPRKQGRRNIMLRRPMVPCLEDFQNLRELLLSSDEGILPREAPAGIVLPSPLPDGSYTSVRRKGSETSMTSTGFRSGLGPATSVTIQDTKRKRLARLFIQPDGTVAPSPRIVLPLERMLGDIPFTGSLQRFAQRGGRDHRKWLQITEAARLHPHFRKFAMEGWPIHVAVYHGEQREQHTELFLPPGGAEVFAQGARSPSASLNGVTNALQNSMFAAGIPNDDLVHVPFRSNGNIAPRKENGLAPPSIDGVKRREAKRFIREYCGRCDPIAIDRVMDFFKLMGISILEKKGDAKHRHVEGPRGTMHNIHSKPLRARKMYLRMVFEIVDDCSDGIEVLAQKLRRASSPSASSSS